MNLVKSFVNRVLPLMLLTGMAWTGTRSVAGVIYDKPCRRLADLQVRPLKLEVYRGVIKDFLQRRVGYSERDASDIAGSKVMEMLVQLEAFDKKSDGQNWHYDDNDVFYHANGVLGAQLVGLRRKPGDPPPDYRAVDADNDLFYDYTKAAMEKMEKGRGKNLP